jgi:co-chaperonin GroES (HSP10)
MKPRLVQTEHGHYEHASFNGENTAGFTPLSDKVMVKPDKAAATIGSKGLLVATADQQERQSIGSITGVIIALGHNAWLDMPAQERPKPGTRVLFGRYQGQVFRGTDGDDYRVMTDDSIGGIFKETNT